MIINIKNAGFMKSVVVFFGFTNCYRVSVIFFCAMCLSLNACSSKKNVVSIDESADYKSARELPPLTKKQIKLSSGNAVLPASQASDKQVVGASKNSDLTLHASPGINSSDETSSATSETVAAPTQLTKQPYTVTPALLVDNNTTQLSLDTNTDDAWTFLTNKLAGSNITVFSRNKSAGRIAIGCAEIGRDTHTIQSGKWSIFKRKEIVMNEYCSLKVFNSANSTRVSVLNRSNQTASIDESRMIFKRLLN